MRVIAGDARGTRLEALQGEETRPTIERVKEAMLSTVQFTLGGALVLDLFAGSGQLGIEALSRGAKSCVFIDQSREAINIIQKNLKTAKLYEKARVAQGNAESFLSTCKDKFDLIFLDPPYKSNIPQSILPLLSDNMSLNGIAIIETERGAKLPDRAGALILVKQYNYGTVMVSKYVLKEQAQCE